MTKREIENLIDEKNRVQEKQQADSQLEGLVREMKSILATGKKATWQSWQEWQQGNINTYYNKLEKIRDHSRITSVYFSYLPYLKVII